MSLKQWLLNLTGFDCKCELACVNGKTCEGYTTTNVVCNVDGGFGCGIRSRTLGDK